MMNVLHSKNRSRFFGVVLFLAALMTFLGISGV